MPLTNPRDRFVITTASVVVAVLLGALAGLWYFLHAPRAADPGLSYAIVGPLTVRTDDFSVVARLAVQTSPDNAAWARQQAPALVRSAEAALGQVDPDRIHAPGGLEELQRSLKSSLSRDLGTDRIEQILLTDFLLQMGV